MEPGSQINIFTSKINILTSIVQNVKFVNYKHTQKNELPLTFGIIVREQLDVKLFSEGCQVGRHHTAGGQVDLVTAGLHLIQESKHGSLG